MTPNVLSDSLAFRSVDRDPAILSLDVQVRPPCPYYLDVSNSAQSLRLRDVLLVGSITRHEARRHLAIDDPDSSVKGLVATGYLIVKTIEAHDPEKRIRRNVRYSLLQEGMR